MADATQTAEQSGPAQPSVQEPTYTPEGLTEMVNSGDPAKIREATDILQKLNSGEMTLDRGTPAVPKVDEQPQAQPTNQEIADNALPGETPQETAKRLFKANYQGTEVEWDDSDGFLGRKNEDGLKTSYVNAQMHLKTVEEENSSLREAAAKEAARRRAVEQERESFKQALAEAKSRQVQQPTHSKTPVPAQEVALPGDPPIYPDVPIDPLDWEDSHKEAFKNYQVSQAAWQAKLNQAMTSMSARAQAPTEPQAAINISTENLPPEVRELVEWAKKKKIDDASDNQRAEEEKYWTTVSKFQSLHNEYATPKDIRSLHADVMSWTDRLAKANGLTKPYDVTPDQENVYNGEKMRLVHRFLNGDQDVVNKAQGIETPAGYETYFKIADLQAKKQEYSRRGVLGAQASLHDVWLKDMDENGGFEKNLSQLEVDAQAQGRNGILNALEEHESADAVTVPPGMGEELGPIGRMTSEEATLILQSTPAQLRADPELMKKHTAIISGVGSGAINTR